MGKTRIVITIDAAIRDEVRKRAKAEGKILSAYYKELFVKGHALDTNVD